MPLNELSFEQNPETHAHLGSLARRFSHSDDAECVLPQVDQGLEVVTGFGPTNAPTAGSLSVMLGIIELQQALNCPITVVISELGAWNSRNVPWSRLLEVRDHMITFLRNLGFDETKGQIRSHLDFGNLARAGKLARFLSRQDFLNHQESLLELYESHGLLGSEIGIVVDSLYTVADILGPAEAGAKHILMVSGQEEAYFTELSRLALARQAEAGDLSLGWQATIGALYFRVLEGLAGYPKMSKSIPESAIHLGMTPDELAASINNDNPASQRPLLSAIQLASGWSADRIAVAETAFHAHSQSPGAWTDIKAEYLETFLGFADRWQRST